MFLTYKVVGLFLSLALVHSARLCTDLEVSSEGEDEYVKVTYYNMRRSKWTNSAKNSFSNIFAEVASEYCDDNLSDCGLSSETGDFDEDLVGFTDDSPEYNDDNPYETFVYVYLAYDDSMSITGEDTQCVVPKDAVIEMLINNRKTIDDDVDYYIVGIDSEKFSIPPDTRLNQIIIPLAFAVIIILIIAAIALYCYQAHNEKEFKRMQERDEMKKQRRPGRNVVTPQKHGSTTTSTTTVPMEAVPMEELKVSPRSDYQRPLVSVQPAPPMTQNDVPSYSGQLQASAQPPSHAPSYSGHLQTPSSALNNNVLPYTASNTLQPTASADHHLSPQVGQTGHGSRSLEVNQSSHNSAGYMPLDEMTAGQTSGGKRRKHKKSKKHKRRHGEAEEGEERPSREESSFNIAPDTALRTDTDSDNYAPPRAATALRTNEVY